MQQTTLREKVYSAYMAYRETGDLKAVCELCNLPIQTVEKWADKYQWEDKLERDKKALAERPFDQDKNVKNFAKKFKIEDTNIIEILKQVKMVEGIVEGCLRYNEDDMPIGERSGLKPKTFDQAMKALSMCWKTRLEIFQPKEKKTGTTFNISGDAKIDYLGELQKIHENEIIANQATELLPGQEADAEWTGVQESE